MSATQAELASAVSVILHGEDHIKCILEASIEQDATTAQKPRRLLALISHRDELDGHEEGKGECFSLLVLQPKSLGGLDDLAIDNIFPIVPSCNVAISQSRREATGVRASSHPQRSELRLTLSLDRSDQPSVTLLTHDVQGLKDLLSEHKRFRQLSAEAPNLSQSSPAQFSWLGPYHARHTNALPPFSLAPVDLRDTHKPLHSKLSPAYAGSGSEDAEDIRQICHDWVRTQVREKCIKAKERLSIRVGTFNVNGKLPSQDLSTWVSGKSSKARWLPPLSDVSPFSIGEVLEDPMSKMSTEDDANADGSQEKQDSGNMAFLNPDLLVLGFQELDLSTEGLIYSTRTDKADTWCAAILAGLGDHAEDYEKLVSKQLVGMLIVIFVKKTLKGCFSDIKTASAGTGVMGLMGNKGGTAVRLAYTPASTDKESNCVPTYLSFVNSHLAAFDEMVERRHADFRDLSRRLVFDYVEKAEDEPFPRVSIVSVYECDVLFWMGDLNYRIDVPDTHVRKMLSSSQWTRQLSVLRKYDQLNVAKRDRKAFEFFSEGPLIHFPTYRFSPSELLKDDLGYDLKRRPAWTDRILYLTSPASSSCQIDEPAYTGHREITQSDHRPVSAHFSVTANIYDAKECENTAERLHRQIAGLLDSPTSPKIQVKNSNVDFGAVRHERPTSHRVRVENTGKIACTFRFIPIHAGDAAAPEWLQVEPLTGLLLPNEGTDITLTANITTEAASRLNLEKKELSHTLILHTLRGKDAFINVNAHYEYTCFGNRLTRLTRLPGPIRDLQGPNDLLPEQRAHNAPSEIMRLINWMTSISVSLGSLFVTPGKASLVEIVRECLDTGAPFPKNFASYSHDSDVAAAFGHTLVKLLESLHEPVLPYSLHSRCTQVHSKDEAFEVLEEMPPEAVNVWISVTALLHFITSSASDPERRGSEIASIFSSVLIRDDPNGAIISPFTKEQFLLYFIL